MDGILFVVCLLVLIAAVYFLVLAQIKESNNKKVHEEIKEAKEELRLEFIMQQGKIDRMKEKVIEYIRACENGEEPAELKL